jgi:FXSXX-COOH protein
MTTLHLPDEDPKPETGPNRVPLVRLARESEGSPALLRAVAGVERRGPARVAVAAFQSSV